MPKPTSLDRDSPHGDRTAPRNIVLTRHPAPHSLSSHFPGEWLGRASRLDFPHVKRFYRRGAAGPYDWKDDRVCSIRSRQNRAVRTF